MTLAEYLAAVDGYMIKYYKDLEQTRLICFFIYNSASSKPIKKPTDLFKLPTDTSSDTTLDDMRAIRDYWASQIPK